jgi:hypothetical protein
MNTCEFRPVVLRGDDLALGTECGQWAVVKHHGAWYCEPHYDQVTDADRALTEWLDEVQ